MAAAIAAIAAIAAMVAAATAGHVKKSFRWGEEEVESTTTRMRTDQKGGKLLQANYTIIIMITCKRIRIFITDCLLLPLRTLKTVSSRVTKQADCFCCIVKMFPFSFGTQFTWIRWRTIITVVNNNVNAERRDASHVGVVLRFHCIKLQTKLFNFRHERGGKSKSFALMLYVVPVNGLGTRYTMYAWIEGATATEFYVHNYSTSTGMKQLKFCAALHFQPFWHFN